MIVSRAAECSCALYCRLSNEDSLKGESQSITNQRDLLRRYAKENDMKVYDEYIDDGFSGTNFDRPGYQKMIKDIEEKRVNTVIVKDSSRLGRDYIQFGEYVEKFFPQNKVRVISILDNYDSEIDNGVADTLPFKAVMNDFYAKDTSKKVRSTKQKNAKQGLFMGRYAPYGYLKSKDDKHKLIIDPPCADIVKKIFDLYLEGYSPLQISYKLVEAKIPSPSLSMNMQRPSARWYPNVVRRILGNEMYIGNMVQGKKRKINYKLKKVIDLPKEDWIVVENTHEAIIDKEKFYTVQDMLKSRQKTRCKNLDLLLRGLVVCKDCGRKMSTTVDYSTKSKTKYLRCSSYVDAPKQKFCTSHLIRYDLVENAVKKQVQEICRKYLDRSKLKEIVDIENEERNREKKLKDEKRITEKSIEILKNQIDKIYEDKLNGLLKDEDFKRLYDKKLEEKEKQEQRLKQLDRVEIKKVDTNYEEVITEFLSEENISRYMLSTLIEKIEIDDKKQVIIHYKFSPLNFLS